MHATSPFQYNAIQTPHSSSPLKDKALSFTFLTLICLKFWLCAWDNIQKYAPSATLFQTRSANAHPFLCLVSNCELKGSLSLSSNKNNRHSSAV